MGIFDFLKPKENESEIIKKLFPSLKGIHFKSISTIPKGDSFEKFFNSDIDGKWFFSVHNFAMIFKSFSDENYEKELNDLLNITGQTKIKVVFRDNSKYYKFELEQARKFDFNLFSLIKNKEYVKKINF